MILTLFAVFAFISLLLVFFGLYADCTLGIIGGVILFLLGASMLNAPITYAQGENVTYTYSYVNASAGTIGNITMSSNPVMKSFDEQLPFQNNGGWINLNRILGIIISILGGVTAAIFMIRVNINRGAGSES